MKKRAQGLSMKTIVVAILSLTVLVVIIVIFSSQIGEVAKGFTSARESANLCRTDSINKQECVKEEIPCPNGWEKTSAKCEISEYKCCKEKIE
jgi:hypothetical protein|tara:strand:- start:1 stop:279 length:279 start_codon:yes stop_codon:yes gene_type:complete